MAPSLLFQSRRVLPCPAQPPFSRRPSQLVAIHDSARPLVAAEDALKCFEDAWEVRGHYLWEEGEWGSMGCLQSWRLGSCGFGGGS